MARRSLENNRNWFENYSYLMHLDHGEEAVRVLLVAVASVQPGQQQVKGVAELVTVASPDL